METQELIKSLAADNQRSGMPMTLVWTGAAVIAIGVAACVFFVLLGPRPDIASAMQTLRFPFKIVVAIALAVSSLSALRALSRPETEPRDLLPPSDRRSGADRDGGPRRAHRHAGEHMVREARRNEQSRVPDLHPADRHRAPRAAAPCAALWGFFSFRGFRRSCRIGCRRHCGGLLCLALHGRLSAFRRNLVLDGGGNFGHCRGTCRSPRNSLVSSGPAPAQ